MATKDTNQVSIRLDDDAKQDVELLRQEDIKGKLEMRATNPDLYDQHHDKPTPPTRSELCKRVLQGAIRSMAASPGGVTVDV